MTRENHHKDRKSLRLVTGRTADFQALAADCVCFANAAGGTLEIGIEDDADLPPADQRVPPELPDQIRRRIGELAVNVQVAPQSVKAVNGGEYVVLAVAPSIGVASTKDGRYFMRVGDSCHPILGDDVLRLLADRPGSPWESLDGLQVEAAAADTGKQHDLLARLRASDRVKPSVKEKCDAELLRHYGLARGSLLTNLGVLIVGKSEDRARLGSAPVVRPSSSTIVARRSTSGRGTTTPCRRWSWLMQ